MDLNWWFCSKKTLQFSKQQIKNLAFTPKTTPSQTISAYLRRHLTVVGFLQLTRLVVEVHQGCNQGKSGEEHEEDGLDAKAGRRRGPVLVAAGLPGLDLFVEQARILAAGRLFGFGVLVVLLFARHGGGVVVGVGRSLKWRKDYIWMRCDLPVSFFGVQFMMMCYVCNWGRFRLG